MIELPKGVRLGVFSSQKLFDLWQKMRKFDSLFVEDDSRNPEVFVQKFLDPRSVILEIDEGFMLMKKIVPGLSGEIHFTFFDRKLSPRANLMKECLVWAFLTYNLERVETTVADYARAVRHFAEKMGFKEEGILRNKARHNGRLIDVYIYSILKKEVLKDG